jgi:peptidoglycan/LPS O-acetylase OafA/YrhL
MWFIKTLQNEDEETLLTSPCSSTSNFSEFAFPPPARWKRVTRFIFGTPLRLLLFTMPSFLRSAPTTTVSKGSEKHSLMNAPRKFSTEYLDGVRGLASFIVFIFHFTHLLFPSTNSGYIAGSNNTSIWQLPIIRFAYSGAAMVSIFFIVSGYVLTHRYIQKMYRQEYLSLYTSLTSLTFRRALRLFLPSLASCIIAFICASLGIITAPTKRHHEPFTHGLPALLQYIDLESNPWTWEPYVEGFYNPQLWSISLEYRGSMVVFLSVLGLARTRTCVRVATESAIIIHAFGHKRWDVALFMCGMFIAEVDVFIHSSTTRKAMMQKKITKALLITSILVGLWLSGYPRDHGLKSYGYGFLRDIPPYTGYRRRFWLAISAIMIIGPLPYLPSIQNFFTTRLLKYLGRISFALYLVHGLGNRTVGISILNWTGSMFGTEGYWVDVLRCSVSLLLYVPIIIWWSDIFYRAIDAPSARFAKWIEGICANNTTS